MSMYNDASLALIPSAVGDGVVYNARPVEALGAELILNGDFATDSDWAKGTEWTIGGGVASCDGTQSGLSYINQSGAIVSGKTYKATYEIISISAGEIRIFVGGVSGTPRTTTGVYTEYITAGNTAFWLRGSSSFVGSIDNVSVKEVLTSAQDFDFTRASEATRVLSGGRIEKVRTNRVLYSEDLSNAAWGKERSTVTSNAIANPLDGAVTADKIVVDSTADNNHSVYTLAKYDSTNVQTFSVYLKAGEYTWAAIGNENSTYRGWFDLANGVVGSQNGGVTSASISDAGGGWYRCSLVIIGWPVNGIQMFATPSDATLNTVGVGSGGFYSYGVQLEQGLVATEYIATTSTSVSVGSVNDMPRLDWSGGCPSLKLEPSRTNLITYSEYYGASYWTKSGSTIVENATTSPDGSLNASKLVEDTSSGSHLLRSNAITISSGVNYTFSVFVKKNTRSWVALSHDSSTGHNAWFDLENGAFGTSGFTTSSFEDYGNGWYRISLSILSDGTTGRMRMFTSTGNNVFSYTGDGSSGIYIYGAQLEAGNFSTSYIPSYGTATTRAVDECTGAGDASTFNDSEGVFYVDMSTLSLSDTSERKVSISNGGTSYARIQYGGTSGQIYCFIYVNGVKVADIRKSGLDTSVPNKVALRWSASGYSAFVNGTLIETDAFVSDFTSYPLTDLSFAGFKGKVDQILVFNTALSDTELEKLTTL